MLGTRKDMVVTGVVSQRHGAGPKNLERFGPARAVRAGCIVSSHDEERPTLGVVMIACRNM